MGWCIRVGLNCWVGLGVEVYDFEICFDGVVQGYRVEE